MPFKGLAGASPAFEGSVAPIVGGTGRGFAVLLGAAGCEADFGSAGNLAGGRAAGADSGLPLR
ncbi:MAG TPA: hypothetical protein VKJ45_23065, partial [Blastocatellia bacterium]|nr:hypothetical protein [Blastocatellia bacterium]